LSKIEDFSQVSQTEFMCVLHVETNIISLFQTSMNVMTLQWLLDVSWMLSAVTCQPTSCANVNLGLKVMERWNV